MARTKSVAKRVPQIDPKLLESGAKFEHLEIVSSEAKLADHPTEKIERKTKDGSKLVAAPINGTIQVLVPKNTSAGVIALSSHLKEHEGIDGGVWLAKVARAYRINSANSAARSRFTLPTETGEAFLQSAVDAACADNLTYFIGAPGSREHDPIKQKANSVEQMMREGRSKKDILAWIAANME